MAQAQEVFLFNPLSIVGGGCQLWLDAADPSNNGTVPANGATISTWSDKSGNGRNMTATISGTGTITYSTYKGIGSILFNSTNANPAYMRVNSAVNLTSFTVFAISRSQTAVGNQNGLLGIPQAGAGIAEYNSTDGFGQFVDANVTAQDRFYGYTSGFAVTNTNPASGGDAFPLRLNAWVVTSTGTTNSYYNGTTGNSVTLAGTRTGTATGFGIGFDIAGSPQTIANTITVSQFSEFIVYNTVLNDSQRQQVEGYLAWKWGLQGSLPSNHPYKTYRPLAAQPFTTLVPQMPILTTNQGLSNFSPSNVSGLILWLDANDSTTIQQTGGNVTQWSDKSTSGWTFSNVSGANRPTYSATGLNGRPTLTFASSYLTRTNTGTSALSAYTAFFVTNKTAGSSVGYFIDFQSGRLVYGWTDSASLGLGMFNGSWNATGVTIFGPQYVSYVSKTGGAIYQNGSNYATIPTFPSVTLDGAISIGSRFSLDSYFVSASISEIIFYNSALSDTDRNNVQNYLAWKWGLFPFLYSVPRFNGSLTQWLPTSLFSGQWLSVWFDCADRTTMTMSGSNLLTITSKGNISITCSSTATNSAGTLYTGTNTVNGLNTIEIPSPGRILYGTTNTAVAFYPYQARTIFVVYRVVTSVPEFISFFTQQFNGGQNYGQTQYTYATGNNYTLYSHTSTGDSSIIQALSPSQTAPYTSMICWNQSSTTTANNFITLNGSNLSLAGYNQIASTYSNSTQYYIGNVYPQPYLLCEYIMWNPNTEVTTTQTQQVEGYLAWKWGIQGQLPRTHPYKFFPPPPS